MNYIKRVLFAACMLAGSISSAVENDTLRVSLTFASWDECERVRQEIAGEFLNEFEYGVSKGALDTNFI